MSKNRRASGGLGGIARVAVINGGRRLQERVILIRGVYAAEDIYTVVQTVLSKVNILSVGIWATQSKRGYGGVPLNTIRSLT